MAGFESTTCAIILGSPLLDYKECMNLLGLRPPSAGGEGLTGVLRERQRGEPLQN